MAWIESHQSLAKHPKLLRAAKALAISRPTMVGHLHYLWWWALDFAEDGDLSPFSNTEIAEASEWQGDADAFCTVLMDVKFLSYDRRIHDWEDYAGRLVTSRQRNRDRQREYRLRHAHVTVMSPPRHRATVPNPTVPNPTVREDAADAAPLLQTPAQALQEKKPWEPPEFYRALTLLDGYTHKDHSRAAAVVEAACKDAGVDPKVVVDHFAADYPALKHTYAWTDPAAALRGKPLAVAISQIKGGTNGRRPQGKDLHQMRRELENGADQGRPVRSI